MLDTDSEIIFNFNIIGSLKKNNEPLKLQIKSHYNIETLYKLEFCEINSY